jgi:hypothetical protein
LCGNGRHDAKNLAGILNLNLNNEESLDRTQETIGKVLIEVGRGSGREFGDRMPAIAER